MKTRTVFLIIPLVISFWGYLDAYDPATNQSPSIRPVIEVSQNVTISSQFQGLPVVEPHLAAHPANNNHLLAAAMVVTDISRPYESCRLSTFVSTDGGDNWEETVHDYWGYDPWVAISANGETALSWLGTKGSFQHEFPIQFFRSGDGGLSWSASSQTVRAEHGHDGTKIVSKGNDFYFSSVRFNDDMSADVILYHKAKEGPFREVGKINGQGVRLNFCEPAILSDGTVVVPASHFLKKVWVQWYDPTSSSLSDKHMLSVRPGGARGYMRMAADTSASSLFQDRIYFVRALGNRGKYEGIWFNYSEDKGKTWSRDIRVDSFTNTFPSKAMVASLAINKDGVLAISWVDSQHDPQQQLNEVYCAVSTDGGLTFTLPVQVSDQLSNPNTAKNGDVANKFPGGGHYLNMVAKTDGSFQVIWSDSRSGIFELQTSNMKIT